jgi:MFS transporter, FSR family, fosmidomycin resistance protein
LSIDKNSGLEKMKDATKTLFATSLAHFINDGAMYVFITLNPKLLVSQLFLIGVLVSLFSLFSVFVSPIVGRRADAGKNYGGLMTLGLVLMGIGIAGYSVSVIFASGFSLFLFLVPFSIIAGVGSSFYHPIGASALQGIWKGESIGQALGINGAMGSLGRAVYPLFVAVLVVYLTIPSVIILAVIAFVAASLISTLMYDINFKKPDATVESTSQGSANSGKPIPMSSVLPLVLPLTILSFSRGMFMLGIITFIPTYLTQELSFGFLELGVIFTGVLAMGIISQPIWGALADRFGRRLALGISMIGGTVAVLSSIYSTDPLIAIVSLGVFGFFAMNGFPLLMPLAAAAVPESARAISNSIVWGIGTVGGGILGPVLVGLLAEPAFLGTLKEAYLVVTLVTLVPVVLLPFVRIQSPKDLKLLYD